MCFCANTWPKLNKLWKTITKQPFLIDFLDFMRFFWSLFHLDWTLAQKHILVLFQFFWHPWNPWGRVNSVDTILLRFVFDFSACQCLPSGGFFHSSQSEARCHDLTWIKVTTLLFIATMAKFSKVIQAVSDVFWKESELISPVWAGAGRQGQLGRGS